MAPCKGFVCVLELHIRTVTCPGVALKSREDVYVSACIFGQHKKTSCVRAIFPLIFDEKLMFEKVYSDVVDPGDLIELFETDTSVVQLIQTVPPGNCTKTEVSYNLCYFRQSVKFTKSSEAEAEGMRQIKSSKKNTASPERNRPSLATKSYEQPTVASLSRSPSPYTKRRMCELLQIRQRLAHLDLGPFDFRKETDRPPFVIRRVEELTPSPQVHTWCRPKEGAAYDPSLLGSYRPKNTKIIGSHHEKHFDCFPDTYDEHLITKMSSRQVYSDRLLIHSAPASLQNFFSTPVINRSSLRERFYTGWNTPVNGDEIHKRVKSILRTHSARQRLTFDETSLSKEESAKTRDSTGTRDFRKRDVSHTDSLNSNFQNSSFSQPNVMVHLDNGEYWTNQVAEYKNKPHRAIFEDSLEKIYRNMYRNASSSLSKNKSN
ncbi:spermatogenesis-associated protein 6 isoform X5 [Crotalus tigris]|uniref:spermatogenesis-associated protein 6 isoform X5 n=1 Tax=Crotalus tigris TaxID=88082 RepID=UPI00192FACBE|nr:spermatogenesis-associated protein 6 isoform X5 [Crotalus tigris]